MTVTTAPPAPGGLITGIQQPVTQPTIAGRRHRREGSGEGCEGTGDGGVQEVAAGNGAAQPAAQDFAVATSPVQPPAPRDPLPLLLYVVAAVVALVAIFGPPALTFYLRRSRT